MAYCSPGHKNSHICFDNKDLKTIARVFNHYHSTKIKIRSNNIFEQLEDKLSKFVGNNSQHKWIDYLLSKINNNLSERTKLKQLCISLLPKKPKEWNKNPYTWLSNFDIEAVLSRYSKAKKYKYYFIGVFSIDFALTYKNGSCKINSNCRIDIQDVIDKGCKYMGLVTNLDKHDEPGSHWTSTFFVIDPKLKAYGIYYYDSVGNKMPSLTYEYIIDIQNQLEKKYGKRPQSFQNKRQHQRGNSECGMFSIYYQLRWLKLLQKNKKTTFKDVIDVPITDKLVNDLRNVLFRP